MRFKTSNFAVLRSFREGDDPLQYLLPWELKAAEVYVRLGALPMFTNKRGEPYADKFHEVLYAELPVLPHQAYLKNLQRNAAWIVYVQYLKEHARDVAVEKLHNTAQRAVDNYLWAQEAAREAQDYRETRMAASDHLDRIGATEKPPTQVVQVANIQLHSRNFDAANLLAPSPELVGEIDQPADDHSEQS